MSKERKFEVRTDEVNDILTKTPSWMVRSGSFVMLGIVVLLVFLSAIFKYPDVIKAPVVITATNMPAQLVSRKSGRIAQILVSNNSRVSKGEVIAIVENTADFDDYLQLSELLGQKPGWTIAYPALSGLGEMQEAYSRFAKSVQEYKSFVSLDYHGKMARTLRSELEIKEEQSGVSQHRVEIAQDQFQIAKLQYDREKELFEKGAISKQEMEKAQSTFLAAEQNLQNLKEELLRSRTDHLKVSQSLLTTESEKEGILDRLKRDCESGYSGLVSSVRSWEEQNLFISPEEGVVAFTSYWQENQNVVAGDVIFTVLPNQSKEIQGKVYLPLAGAGKVKEGQKVNVKLDSYPYMEYGTVPATIGSLSVIPSSRGKERAYVVLVDFPEGLVTTYSVELEFGEEMHGLAEIITEERSLLARILFPLKHLIQTHF